jgi:hypothetical protein
MKRVASIQRSSCAKWSLRWRSISACQAMSKSLYPGLLHQPANPTNSRWVSSIKAVQRQRIGHQKKKNHTSKVMAKLRSPVRAGVKSMSRR